MTKRRVLSICPYCGVGCGIHLLTQDNTLVGVEPVENHPISRGQLCAKGWSTAYGVEAGNRIQHPLIKTPNGFQQASWDEAIDTICESLKTVLSESGPEAVGIISSARATNEDNYAAQKLARAVFQSNNVDHCARICHSPTVAGLKQTLGSGAMTNSAADISSTDLIMVVGADPTENHSILGGHIIKAKLNGTKLIVIDPRRTRLAKMADLHLQLKPGSNIALLNAMLEHIIKQQWVNEDFVEQRCDGFEQLCSGVNGAFEQAQQLSGVEPALIEQAARAYSQAKRAMILYGMGITQFVSGTNNVIALSNLALCCGHIGREGTGINPLRGQNNVQGACDMGCLPNVFPGYQAVNDQQSIERFSQAWHTPLSGQPGLTSLGMSKAAAQGALRALILFGEDPVVTDPDQNQVRLSLQQLELLVVAELTMTETAKLADVILPAASFAEKEGTFTNCERRVQHISPALLPLGEARADWQWLAAIAKGLGSQQLDWQNAQQIFDEMASVTPSYSGMSYPAIKQQQGLQWPCNSDHPNGSSVLHTTRFATQSGRAQLIPVHHVSIDETPDEQYPLLLTTNRLHFHYGCGSMTRKSPLLERETPAGILFINPVDAAQYGLQQYSAVGIRSRRGYVQTRAMLTDDVPPGVVSMPYHFREAPSNQLTNNAQDPVTKMPELKACAVAVSPLTADQPVHSHDDVPAV